MEYSICIEPLFEEIPFEDRVKMVSEVGFNTIEFWDPEGKDLEKLKDECKKYNISIAICTVKNPWGDKRLNAPTKDFIKNLEETIPLLKKIDCKRAIVLAGEIEKDKSIASQKLHIIESLKEASKIAEDQNIELVLEALNSYVDHKGYFLDSSSLGFEIVKEVASSRIKLLYDIYHMQIMEGNIISNVKDNIGLIGHFHSAGVPGRHELTAGELNYKKIIEEIENAGYEGYFGLEYWPSVDDKESLIQTLKFLNL
jgi:hydroxypyruvate isomerase